MVLKNFSAAAAAAKLLQSSNSVRPHRQQPTRLLCPWDSPGKNTGVGCHFLLQCMKVKSSHSHMVALFLVFKGISILSSIVDISMYIPTSNTRGFPLLCTLSSIYVL